MMDDDQVLLSDELLLVVRGAVTFAVEYGALFVAPAHILLALMDDPKVGPALGEVLERGRVVAAARQAAAGAVHEVGEGVLPRGEKPPFTPYGAGFVPIASTVRISSRYSNSCGSVIFSSSQRAATASPSSPSSRR
jgi:hypothetical protein